MFKTKLCLTTAALSFAATGMAFASAPVPAPILGAGLPGLALLGLAGGGYLVMKWIRKRD